MDFVVPGFDSIFPTAHISTRHIKILTVPRTAGVLEPPRICKVIGPVLGYLANLRIHTHTHHTQNARTSISKLLSMYYTTPYTFRLSFMGGAPCFLR
jgi:hypothetical protein